MASGHTSTRIVVQLAATATGIEVPVVWTTSATMSCQAAGYSVDPAVRSTIADVRVDPLPLSTMCAMTEKWKGVSYGCGKLSGPRIGRAYSSTHTAMLRRKPME